MLQKIICCVLLLFLKTWSYGQAEVIPGLFTTYKENGRILWAIPEQMMGRDMSLTTTILKGAERKMKSDIISYAGKLLEIVEANTLVVGLDNDNRPFVWECKGRLTDALDFSLDTY